MIQENSVEFPSERNITQFYIQTHNIGVFQLLEHSATKII